MADLFSVVRPGAGWSRNYRLSLKVEVQISQISHPLHPGEVLQELYLNPLGLSSYTLAKHIHVPRTRIERLVRGDTALTADTAMRLAKVFGTTAEYWMNLQRAWNLARAKEQIDVSDIEPLAAA